MSDPPAVHGVTTNAGTRTARARVGHARIKFAAFLGVATFRGARTSNSVNSVMNRVREISLSG